MFLLKYVLIREEFIIFERSTCTTKCSNKIELLYLIPDVHCLVNCAVVIVHVSDPRLVVN